MTYLVLASIGLSIVIAQVRGGKLSQLGEIRFRLWWVIPVVTLIQSALVRSPHPEERLAWWHPRPVIMVSSYLVLCAVVWLNRDLPGMRIAFAGIALNLLAIAANGGYMPVSPETLARIRGDGVLSLPIGSVVWGSKDVVLPSQQALFWFLGDVLVIPPPFPWPTAMSMGDVLVAVGVFAFILGTTRPHRESEQDTDEPEHIVHHD